MNDLETNSMQRFDMILAMISARIMSLRCLPGGCTDSKGHLLKTDQRGKPRPDKEDTGGCDMGAYERQSD
jgi:hypothetical protein